MAVTDDLRKLTSRLADQIGQLQQGEDLDARRQLSCGVEAIDRLLPQRGIARGTLVEWIATARGSGATILALLAARQACRDGGPLVVVDRRGSFYPPAAAAWGLELSRMILVRPSSERDEAWAVDQTLRTSGVAALLAWPRRLEDRAFRRLQLAARASQAIGLLVRPASAYHEPSWGAVRLAVETVASDPVAWRLQVQCLRAPGRRGDLSAVEIQIDDHGNTQPVTGADLLLTKYAGRRGCETQSST